VSGVIRKLGIALLVVIAVLTDAGAAEGGQHSTVYVDDDPGCGGLAPCYGKLGVAAIDVQPGGTVSVLPGTFQENVTVVGKVVHFKSTSGPDVTIIDGGGKASVFRLRESLSTIEGFTLTGGGGQFALGENGWGVLMYGSSRVAGTVRGNVIYGNSRSGIGARYSGLPIVDVDVTIENNFVTENGAKNFSSWPEGPGISVSVAPWQHTTGSVVIQNNLVVGNGNINGVGGGVYIDSLPLPGADPGEVSVALVNNTIYGNSAAYGGGVSYQGSVINIVNNVLYGNSATQNTDLQIHTPPPDWDTYISHNIIGDGQYNGVNGNLASDPQFVDVAGNDFRLLSGSPAIDAGDELLCSPKDYADRERPIDGNNDATPSCDIGAFEYCPATPDADGDLAGDACDAPGSGNVDCSGPAAGATSVDALKLLRHNAGLSVAQSEPCLDIGQPRALAPPDNRLMGDVDCSGIVNSVDALKILRAVAGLSVAKPVGCWPLNAPPQPPPILQVGLRADGDDPDADFEDPELTGDGSVVTYRLVIDNDSAFPATITSLLDDVVPVACLDGNGDSVVGLTLAADDGDAEIVTADGPDAAVCTFEKTVSGGSGVQIVTLVTAFAQGAGPPGGDSDITLVIIA